MFLYLALLEPDRKAGGYVVTFPDFSYGVTQGDELEQAMEMAADLLKCLITDSMRKNLDLPPPGRLRGKNMRLVSLTVLQEAKVSLYASMRGAGVRPVDLARRLGRARSEIDHLLDLDHASRMDRLETAFRALDKRLTIAVEDAA